MTAAALAVNMSSIFPSTEALTAVPIGVTVTAAVDAAALLADTGPDVAGVARVSARLPSVVEALVAQDASAEDIGRVVTAIGDAVERRLIALAEAELGGAPAAYSWVTLGSRLVTLPMPIRN